MTISTLASLGTTHRSILQNIKTFGTVLLTLSLGVTVSSCSSQGTTIVGSPGQQETHSLQAAEGDGQVGIVGAVLPKPITARVVTDRGRAVSGVTVKWTFPKGAGASSPTGQETQTLTSVTDKFGLASVYWKLDTIAGQQEATAALPNGTQNAPSSKAKFHSNGKAATPDSVLVSPSSATLTVGQPILLTATVLDKWGNVVSGADVGWSSSDASVASVDAGGTVTGLAGGTATIFATSANAVGQAPVAVGASNFPAVTSVTATTQTVTLSAIGAAAQLSATATDAAGAAVQGVTFQWTSLSTAVATVDAKGFVTAQTNGTAAVVVSAKGSTAADTVNVTVSQQAAQLTVSPDSLNIQMGATTQLYASVLDANGHAMTGVSVTWSSSNNSVVSVDAQGMVTAETQGSAMVMASTDGAAATSEMAGPSGVSAVTGEAAVNVSTTAPGTVTDLQVVSATGSTVTLRWTEVDDGTGSPAKYALRYGTPTLSWSAAYSTEVSVSGTAVGNSIEYTFTGLQPSTLYQFGMVSYSGSLDVAPTFGGISNFVSQTTGTVTASAATVTATPQSVTLSAIGATTQLSAAAKDASGNAVAGAGYQWTSSNTSVATVDGTGLVTAKGNGTASMIVSVTGSSAKDTVAVTVAVTQAAAPSAVSDLRVVSVTTGSVTLRWTQVDDGTGSPAKYALRYGTPTMSSWAGAYPTEVSVTGTAVGTSIDYTYTGLQSATNYQFQMVSYRGTLNVDATFGGLSNTASAVTTGAATFQTPTVTATPASLSFSSLNATAQLSAVAKDSTGTTVANPGFTWRSLATSIAIVSTSGLVTAKAAGTTSVIVSSACCGADTVPVSVSIPVTPPSGTAYFQDGFESGDRSHTENGFVWGGGSAKSGDYVTVSTDYAHSGTHSLKFHYQGRADGQDGWAEQRFVVAPDAASAPSEIWLDYYIRFPSNFAYRTQTSSTNNKLLYIWSETYGGAGDSQVGIEYNHDSGGTGWIKESQTATHGIRSDGLTSVQGSLNGDPTSYRKSPMFTVSGVRGVWKHFQIHLRVANGPPETATDHGADEMWVDGVLVAQINGFNLYPRDLTGAYYTYFRNGYLMGWANSGFANDTDIYIDDFKVYTSNPGW